MKLIALFLLAVIAFAQLPVKNVDGKGNELNFASSGRPFTVYMTTVPNSATVVTDGTTTINQDFGLQLLYCSNPTGGAVTLSFSDNQGSPVSYATTVSLAANSVNGVFASPIGLRMKGGMKWTAGTSSAISCQVQGVF